MGYNSKTHRNTIEPSFFFVEIKSTGEKIKVYIFYDWPHMGKCLRNNWLGDFKSWKEKNSDKPDYEYPGNQIEFNGKIGHWRDVVLLWEWHEANGSKRIDKTKMKSSVLLLQPR